MNASLPAMLCVRCREQPAAGEHEGLPACPRCADLLRNRGDTARSCPVDGEELRKEVLENLVVDRCPACGGIWLDHEELEALLRLVAERDEDGAFMNAVLLGLAW